MEPKKNIPATQPPRNDEIEIDLLHVASVLWKHVVGILFLGLVMGVVFFFVARLFISPKYEANALFYVDNSNTFSLRSVISTGELSAASELVDTYLAILESRANIDLVRERSGVDYSYEELGEMITGKAVNSTGLFSISVRSGNPEEARIIANAIADILPGKISEFVSNSSVEVVDYAVTPRTRVSPSYIKYTAIGVLLGMLIYAGIVLLRDFMDDVIHSEDYLLQTGMGPVLASIPDLASHSGGNYGYGYYGAAKKKGGS